MASLYVAQCSLICDFSAVYNGSMSTRGAEVLAGGPVPAATGFCSAGVIVLPVPLTCSVFGVMVGVEDGSAMDSERVMLAMMPEVATAGGRDARDGRRV